MATKPVKTAKLQKRVVEVKDVKPKARLTGGATAARTGNVFTVTFGGSL
jgi:hypothetical protein